MLSIIIPVFNAHEFLKDTLASLFENTQSPFELVLIDDASDSETESFVNSISAPQITLIKVRNPKQMWVNYNWNMGARISQGDYLAFLNSDIQLSPAWDIPLMNKLDESTVSCPYEELNGQMITLTPFLKSHFPDMLKGCAFMIKRKDVDSIFPIPPQIKHWFGDNWIADKANEMKGVSFCPESVVRHAFTRSGHTVERRRYIQRIAQDTLEYERLTDKDMGFIKERFVEN